MGPIVIAGLGYAYGDNMLNDRFDGRVGSRVSHAWIDRDGERTSTLDLFGRAFVLLVRGHDWADAARDFPGLTVVPVAPGPWVDQLGLSGDGAILVRPDGFVAWRSDESHDRQRAVADALDAAGGPGRAGLRRG